MKLNRTLRDCVYGMAVGDALGVPFEFSRVEALSALTWWAAAATTNSLVRGAMTRAWRSRCATAIASWDVSIAMTFCDGSAHGSTMGRTRRTAWPSTTAMPRAKALATGRGGTGEWDKGQRVAHALLAHGFHGLHECRGARSERHHARDRCLHGCVRK